jgi:hypothetical protein
MIQATYRDQNNFDTLSIVSLPTYFHNLKEDGLLKHAFYDGSVQDLRAFWALVFNPNVTFTLIFKPYKDRKDMAVVGHMYFTNHAGYCANVHFNLLRKYHKDAIEIGEECLSTVKKLTRADGTPFATSLIGLTPETNFAALKTIKRLGFEEITRLKDSCFLYHYNKYVDGVLTRKVL